MKVGISHQKKSTFTWPTILFPALFHKGHTDMLVTCITKMLLFWKICCKAGSHPSDIRCDRVTSLCFRAPTVRIWQESTQYGLSVPIPEPFGLVAFHCSLWKKSQVAHIQGQEIMTVCYSVRHVREMESALRPHSLQSPFQEVSPMLSGLSRSPAG